MRKERNENTPKAAVMRRVVAIAILVALIAQMAPHAAFALEQDDLNPRLGIPTQPRSLGDEYSDGGQAASFKLGLGSCGDLGIDTSVQNLIGLASQVINNAKGLASAAAMATLSYMMPTEFSVVANLSSQAQKILQILADRCKVYQEARKHLEKEDIAGVRQAAYAKCMEKRSKLEGDAAQISCSNPETAWQDLWGTTGCISAIEKSTENVSQLPEGMDRATLKAWFGDFKICAKGSHTAIPPTLNASKLNDTIMAAYTNNVMNALNEAKSRYLTDSDIKAKHLCVGESKSNTQGVICPSPETINMLSQLPPEEQTLYARRLASNLALLETVYRTYAMSVIVEKAAASNPNMAGIREQTVQNLANKKEKELTAYLKTVQLARGGADGDLGKWEKEVIARRDYWVAQNHAITQQKASQQALGGRPNNKQTSDQDAQQRIERASGSYGKGN